MDNKDKEILRQTCKEIIALTGCLLGDTRCLCRRHEVLNIEDKIMTIFKMAEDSNGKH